MLGRVVPGTGVRDVALRVAADQFVFSPLFIGATFSALLAMENKLAQLPAKLEADFVATVKSCWSGAGPLLPECWLAIHFI